jgi:predicted N-acetyltransferase YhbS
MIYYRGLLAHEAGLLATVDRAETIEKVYRASGSKLELRDAPMVVAGWDEAELAAFIARLAEAIACGTTVGAWDGARLVGVGSLDPVAVGGDPTTLKLDLLYVSAGYRQQGIGKEITTRLAAAARAQGATQLYISATPTQGTVDAYLRMGAEVLGTPDPHLCEIEPDDIHLLLKLG